LAGRHEQVSVHVPVQRGRSDVAAEFPTASPTDMQYAVAGTSRMHKGIFADVDTCGVMASRLPGGEMMETQSTIMSGLFASTKQKPLPIFATKVMAEKVYMGVAL